MKSLGKSSMTPLKSGVKILPITERFHLLNHNDQVLIKSIITDLRIYATLYSSPDATVYLLTSNVTLIVIPIPSIAYWRWVFFIKCKQFHVTYWVITITMINWSCPYTAGPSIMYIGLSFRAVNRGSDYITVPLFR